MKSIGIPLSDHERNQVFESDPEAVARGREALRLVRTGQISRPKFIRLLSNCRGEALARFARCCADIARHQLADGWASGGSRTAGNGSWV